jgi:hypothetical protein
MRKRGLPSSPLPVVKTLTFHMIIATDINNGDCPECGAKQSLEVRIIREEGFVYGDVSCIKCFEWITDFPSDELLAKGLIASEEH